MSSPIPKAGPPSSGSASRSSSIASNPPVILQEGNGIMDPDTSPSPPQYPPILGGSSSSTPPSLRRTTPVTSTTATVASGSQANKLHSSVSMGSRGAEGAVLGARRASDELTTEPSSFTSIVGGPSTTSISNIRASKHQPLAQGQPQPLQPKPSVVLPGLTSTIIVSGVSSDSPATSGTSTSLTSIRRRNFPEEVGSKCAAFQVICYT